MGFTTHEADGRTGPVEFRLRAPIEIVHGDRVQTPAACAEEDGTHA